MLVNIYELKNFEFSFSDITTILQSPIYRIHKVPCRRFNGFIYIKKGACRYDFNGEVMYLERGALAYLPLKSDHTLTITSENIEFYRINFNVKINGEIALFSNYPMKICDSLSDDGVNAVEELEENCRLEENTMMKTEILARLFLSIYRKNEKLMASRIEPAVKYMREHFSEPFESKKLSSMCMLSTALFYKLFGEEYKISPLEYKNRLLIERAKKLLLTYNISVSEVSFMLGFESPAYFSRFFKKHVGVSPKFYIKES